MNKRAVPVLVLLGLLAVMTACGGAKKYEPQAINEEVDVCVICNMQVKDDAFATQLTTKDGKNYKFDDIGCMNEWKQQNGTGNIGMDFVRDYNDKEWIEYKQAAYVYDASLRTPMAYGVISFKDESSAEAFVREQGVGTVMTAEELENHEWKQNTDMMNMGSHGEEGDSHEHEDKQGEAGQTAEHKDAHGGNSHTQEPSSGQDGMTSHKETDR
ncbi:nitrous oxide reductase accessory protein NosL [Paenibacillus sp. CN-4]|uniref:nitrous oxide reductase accessory protein NosL n=1 Tax=Paenibacillus nanchangensis TaxID=3348343 RepID=UPI003978942E